MNGSATITQLIASAIISGALVSVVAGALLHGYTTRLEGEIKSQRLWKEQSVSILLGPIVMQFDRTKRAFDRYGKRNDYIEAKVMKVGNEKIRDLLLTNGHLIPPELLNDAGKLVEHYDVWLEVYENERVKKKPEVGSQFVFAGPKGYPFPHDAEQNFREKFSEYWNDLYDDT